VVDALDKGSFVKVIPEEKKIIGYSTKYSSGNLPNFKNYFVIYGLIGVLLLNGASQRCLIAIRRSLNIHFFNTH
jgi:hypothetical protein